jgi:hypothetical protein
LPRTKAGFTPGDTVSAGLADLFGKFLRAYGSEAEGSKFE